MSIALRSARSAATYLLARVAPDEEAAPPGFAPIYDEYARFVWRALLRLGVAEGDVEDVVQEVFLVVHRRLPEFAGRSSLRTWVYGVAVRLARNYRRTRLRRRLSIGEPLVEAEQLPEQVERGPDSLLSRAEAARLVTQLLNDLDEDAREVFVLAEFEEMTALEIGEVLSLKPNTVSSRLRLARQAFDLAVRRARARDEWRIR